MADSKASKKLLIAGGVVLAAGIGTFLYQQYQLSKKLCYSANGFRILRFGLDSSTVEINISLENKGELDLDLKRMNFDVYANEIFIASVSQDVLTPIIPHGKADIPVKVSFNPKDILSNIGGILGQSGLDNIQWRFKGKAVVEKWGIPFPLPLNLTYTTNELRSPSTDSVC